MKRLIFMALSASICLLACIGADDTNEAEVSELDEVEYETQGRCTDGACCNDTMCCDATKCQPCDADPFWCAVVRSKMK